MKRSILPLFVAVVLVAQQANAQPGAAAAPQAASGSGRSLGNDFGSSRGSDFSAADARSYSAVSSSSYSESPISRSGSTHSHSVEDRFSGTTDRGSYSPSYSYSVRDKNNLVNSYVNSNNHNLSKSGFTNNMVAATQYTASYGGYTGVTSSVKTDTSGGCQPWSPLMEWLVYRRNQRYGIEYVLPPEFTLSMFDPSPLFIANVQDYIVTDKRSPDMFTFFDGYIVYCHDTAYGLVNLTADGVYFDDGDLQLKIPYKHRGLKAVVLFNERNEELYLKRIGNDKILSRVLHNGRLLIYDYYYSFDKSNFSYGSLSAAYKNREQRPLVVLDQRLNMIRTINRVYGSKLPSNCDWSYVVQHINTLD